MDILSFPTSSPKRARNPLVPEEEKSILNLIEEGNPAIGFLADKARDIYRNYDVEMQSGLPQIVSSSDNPKSYGLLSFGEGDQTAWDDTYSLPEAPAPSGFIPMDTTQTPGTPDTTYYGETPNRELQRNIVTDEFEPVFDPGMVDYYEGEVPQGIIKRAPYATGRDFKTEGKVKEEAEEKARARIWGNYSYDPAEAQSRYEDYMKDIYSKSMMLNAIAALTGGKSRASNFVEMATKRMEMEEAFRDQTRLQSIQRGIYYTEDGVYDPPKNQQEAFDRAMKFGGSADLASKISGYAPADDKTDYVNWYNSLTDETVVKKKGEEPWDNERDREGWVRGTKSVPLAGTERDRMISITDAYLKYGDFDAAVKAYMKARKPDSTYGWTAGRVKREAEEFLISTMSEDQLDAFTYYPREGEKVDIDSIRESGKIAVMTPEGRKFILNKEGDD